MTSAAQHAAAPSSLRHSRLWLAVLAAVCGFQAMAVQTLFLREAVVLMSGSELAWGMALGAWLLGIAIGGGIGGRLATRSCCPQIWLSLLLPAVSIAACISLWAFRGGRGWLSVPPGELLPLTKMLVAAAVLVPPASILVGLAFPFLCAAAGGQASRPSPPLNTGGMGGVLEEASRPPSETSASASSALGRIYALESAGSLLGGAWLSFWAVDHLGPAQTLLLCGALAAAASAALLHTAKPRITSASWLLATFSLAARVLSLAGMTG